MAVNVTCPGCRTSYPVTEDLLGKKIRCKKCQETFTAAAAKSAVASRAADQRITTKPPAKGAAQYDDDEDDAPRRNGNGRGRPMAKRPAPKTSGKGLLVGGIAGGVVLLAAGVGLGVWILNKDEPGTTEPPPVVSSPPPISTGVAKANTPDATTDPNPDPDKPVAAKSSEMKTADAPNKLTIVHDPRPADIRPDTVERVKKSAAYFTVNMAEGLAWGSGWIAERHGNEAYVVTNSHVVGMKEPAKPPPEKVDVCLDSGLATERHFEGKILALDREEDLAVVRIKGKDLPDPLKISPSYDLVESQRLTTMGFPQGGMLAKGLQQGLGTGELKTTLRTRPSTVSGRIFNKDGSVKYISAEGGVDGGNSGGAVVDTNGNVCCVVVAGSTSSNMRFFIPSEYVVHLLLGRVLKVIPGQAVGSVGTVRQPLIATIADPLQRLRKVDAEVWTGPKPDLTKGEKPIRAGGDREPEPKPGDGPRAVANLAYDPSKTLALGEAHRAEAELSLPGLKDNEVYWFQPHYYAKDGTQRWGEAIVLEMGRFPVDAKPVHLAIIHKEDRGQGAARPLEIDSRQAFSYELEGLGGIGSDLALKARLTERITEVKNGDAKVLLQYQDLRPDDELDDTLFRKQFKGVLEAVKWLKATVVVSKDGRYTSPVAIVADVPSDARPLLKAFNGQIVESLEVMALSLPNKDVQPGETWEHETAYTFSLDKNHQNALFKMRCKYIGSRVRDGHEEAVVEITGQVARNDSNSDPNRTGLGGAVGRGPASDPAAPSDDGEEGEKKLGFSGFIHGAAAVDLATGQVTLARTESDMAVVFPATFTDPNNPRNSMTVKVYAGLYLDVVLRRGLTKDPLKAVDVKTLVDAVLPNQPRNYRPLVGVGPPTGAPVTESTLSTAPVVPERNTLMPLDVLDRVQHSAVMIRVDRNDGGGEGSGWFAAPGVIVTNCHVVGMLNKADRPPETITVYLDRGTEKERKLTGELMTVNREDDLAIIRVKADKLPEPFKMAASASLVESIRLSILGFPNGSRLAKGLEQGLGLNSRDLQTTLKTRPTTVTGRILNKADDSVKYVSFEGGADPGNSGGAIVDAKGDVRAILVAGAPNTELRFGIPSEYADRMVQGYPLDILPGRAYLDGSVPKQPIEIRFSDPLGRLTAVAIDYWVGNSGKLRKPSEKKPAAAAGDGPRQTLTLALKPSDRAGERLAAGEFVLPKIDPGQICWLQPRFTNGTGKEQWSRAVVYAPDGPAVERKPALLAVKYRKGTSRDVDLITYTNIYARELGREKAEGLPLKVTLNESVVGTNKLGTARIDVKYLNLDLDIKKILPALEDLPPQVVEMLTARLKPFLNLIKGVIMYVDVTKDGHMNLAPYGLSYSRLPPASQVQLHQFNNQVFTSLQAATFPLPGKEVPYGYTWDFPTDLFIPSKNRSDGATFKMQFKYVGVRNRGGRPEAVVEITGSLIGNPNAKGISTADEKDEPAQPATPADPAEPQAKRFDQAAPPTTPQKSKKGLYGVAHGYALVDVNDGFVGEVKLYIDLTMEMTVKDILSKKDIPVDEGGTMELHLRRRTAQVTK